jgi:hypothetical protein
MDTARAKILVELVQLSESLDEPDATPSYHREEAVVVSTRRRPAVGATVVSSVSSDRLSVPRHCRHHRHSPSSCPT